MIEVAESRRFVGIFAEAGGRERQGEREGQSGRPWFRKLPIALESEVLMKALWPDAPAIRLFSP